MNDTRLDYQDSNSAAEGKEPGTDSKKVDTQTLRVRKVTRKPRTGFHNNLPWRDRDEDD